MDFGTYPHPLEHIRALLLGTASIMSVSMRWPATSQRVPCQHATESGAPSIALAVSGRSRLVQARSVDTGTWHELVADTPTCLTMPPFLQPTPVIGVTHICDLLQKNGA